MTKNNRLTTREILEQSIAQVNRKYGIPGNKLLSLSEANAVSERKRNRKITPDCSEPVSESDILNLLADDYSTTEPDTSCVPCIETETVTTGVIRDGDVDETETTVCVKVPKRFSTAFAEKFDSLDSEWQTYLCSVDAEINREVEQLQRVIDEHKWMDTLHHIKCFNHLSDSSETPREWVEKMAFIEYMLETCPREAIRVLINTYIQPRVTCWGYPVSNRLFSPITVGDYFISQRQDKANRWIDAVLKQKDETGAFKFPYHTAVRGLIIRLLKSGQVRNIEDAYNIAIWCDAGVREKLVEAKVAELIRKKAAEAKRAKKVSFSPSGTGYADPKPKKGRTTREIIEEAMRKCKYKYEH